MRIGVTTLVTVTRDGAGWVTRRYDVRGAVEIPARAATTADKADKGIVWTETPHAVDPHCPVCMSAAPCTQEVTLYPDSGGIVVVHEYAPAQEMN